MNKNDLYLAIGHVDEKLLERSEKAAKKNRAPKIVRIFSIAAVICLMIGGTALLGSAGILSYDLFFRGAGAPAPNDQAVEYQINEEMKEEIIAADAETEIAGTGAPEASEEGIMPTEAKEDEAVNEPQPASRNTLEPIQITFVIALAGFGLGVVLLILVLILKIITRRRKKLDPSGHI